MLNKIEVFELLTEISLKNESIDDLINTINDRNDNEQKLIILIITVI